MQTKETTLDIKGFEVPVIAHYDEYKDFKHEDRIDVHEVVINCTSDQLNEDCAGDLTQEDWKKITDNVNTGATQIKCEEIIVIDENI